nr:hypothetical protein Iba_chr04fCG11060 [Ipomoea batatas]GMD79400.1 hypothetical protein Iba_chr13dCG3520 [Ipomoea batatas]
MLAQSPVGRRQNDRSVSRRRWLAAARLTPAPDRLSADLPPQPQQRLTPAPDRLKKKLLSPKKLLPSSSFRRLEMEERESGIGERCSAAVATGLGETRERDKWQRQRQRQGDWESG